MPKMFARAIRPLVTLTIIGMGLSGCVMPEELSGTSSAVPASNAINVADGTVLVAPRGYCVDEGTLRARGETTFVLFGGCAAISNDPSQPAAPYKAVLGTTVGPVMTGSIPEKFPAVEAFFRSQAGRAALARSGVADDVQILAAEVSGDVLMLKLSDASKFDKVPVAKDYWRAIAGVNGHLVAFSVMPLADTSLSDARQKQLLREFVASTQAAN
ncbi:hypothetical protein BFP70_06705 [Thioclava sp. SK-1]|uniref:hypothetical protein n=1 Tax=Thioclava sp. SK-1 TaxID=1889770 RepID=UPI000826C56A|nr:hypothetical protein [Thioclava sp. SK-1]OCX65826.1 hypothetical protein BFP70_06705 [Thioclava sp. SK-1]